MEEIDIHTILQISRFKKVELTGPPRIGTDATRKVLNLGKCGIGKVPPVGLDFRAYAVTGT